MTKKLQARNERRIAGRQGGLKISRRLEPASSSRDNADTSESEELLVYDDASSQKSKTTSFAEETLPTVNPPGQYTNSHFDVSKLHVVSDPIEVEKENDVEKEVTPETSDSTRRRGPGVGIATAGLLLKDGWEAGSEVLPTELFVSDTDKCFQGQNPLQSETGTNSKKDLPNISSMTAPDISLDVWKPSIIKPAVNFDLGDTEVRLDAFRAPANVIEGGEDLRNFGLHMIRNAENEGARSESPINSKDPWGYNQERIGNREGDDHSISGWSNNSSHASASDSLFSYVSDSSMSSVVRPQSAVETLVSLLLDDEIVKSLCTQALANTAADRFERTLRRFLKEFAMELRKEAKSDRQRHRAHFVHLRARNSAYMICDALNLRRAKVLRELELDDVSDDSDSYSSDDDADDLEQLELFIKPSKAIEKLRAKLKDLINASKVDPTFSIETAQREEVLLLKGESKGTSTNDEISQKAGANTEVQEIILREQKIKDLEDAEAHPTPRIGNITPERPGMQPSWSDMSKDVWIRFVRLLHGLLTGFTTKIMRNRDSEAEPGKIRIHYTCVSKTLENQRLPLMLFRGAAINS